MSTLRSPAVRDEGRVADLNIRDGNMPSLPPNLCSLCCLLLKILHLVVKVFGHDKRADIV